MVSQRRAAQLGVLASTSVFVGCFGVLVVRSMSSPSPESVHLPTLSPAEAQPAAYSYTASAANNSQSHVLVTAK